MKKLISICLFSLLFMLGSSFKTESTAPAPNYTMVEIPDIPSCYAAKVVCTGYLYDDNTMFHQCETIVYNPNYTSIWNMDAKYWYGLGIWMTAHVYVKLYSYSSWNYIGSLSSYNEELVENTMYGYFLGKMSFSYYDLPAPAPK